MKQITSTLARLLVMLTVLIFGAAVEPVNAQDQSLAEGYYYINTTVSDYSGQGMYYDANNTSWRNHHCAELCQQAVVEPRLEPQ